MLNHYLLEITWAVVILCATVATCIGAGVAVRRLWRWWRGRKVSPVEPQPSPAFQQWVEDLKRCPGGVGATGGTDMRPLFFHSWYSRGLSGAARAYMDKSAKFPARSTSAAHVPYGGSRPDESQRPVSLAELEALERKVDYDHHEVRRLEKRVGKAETPSDIRRRFQRIYERLNALEGRGPEMMPDPTPHHLPPGVRVWVRTDGPIGTGFLYIPQRGYAAKEQGWWTQDANHGWRRCRRFIYTGVPITGLYDAEAREVYDDWLGNH